MEFCKVARVDFDGFKHGPFETILTLLPVEKDEQKMTTSLNMALANMAVRPYIGSDGEVYPKFVLSLVDGEEVSK